MRTTAEYINDAKNKLGIGSDYALSKKLGLTKQAISKYQAGDRVMDDYTAAKVANVLEINPLEVIAAANAEREKDSEKRDFWRKMASGAQAAVVGSTLIFGGITQEREVVDNVDNLYIMRNGGMLFLLLVLIWRLHAKKNDRVREVKEKIVH